MATLLSFWTPGALEMVVLLILGLVLFGGNLPEVGKSLGRSLIEFRKGLKELKTSTGLDEVSKVKEEMMNMAREVDPRHMMDLDDESLPDDPYKDEYQDGEFHEVEASEPRTESGAPPEDSENEPEGQNPTERDAEPDPAQGTSESADESVDDGHLEGGRKEPHEEVDPPTFGYDRHG